MFISHPLGLHIEKALFEILGFVFKLFFNLKNSFDYFFIKIDVLSKWITSNEKPFSSLSSYRPLVMTQFSNCLLIFIIIGSLHVILRLKQVITFYNRDEPFLEPVW